MEWSVCVCCSEIICTQIFNYATNCQQTKPSGNARSRYFNFSVILKKNKKIKSIWGCAIYDVLCVCVWMEWHYFLSLVGVSFKAFPHRFSRLSQKLQWSQLQPIATLWIFMTCYILYLSVCVSVCGWSDHDVTAAKQVGLCQRSSNHLNDITRK